MNKQKGPAPMSAGLLNLPPKGAANPDGTRIPSPARPVQPDSHQDDRQDGRQDGRQAVKVSSGQPIGQEPMTPLQAREMLSMPMGRRRTGRIAFTWRVEPDLHERLRLLAIARRTSIQDILDFAIGSLLDTFNDQE